MQVVAAANPATEERKATIEITTNYSLSATIQITQTAGEPTPPEEGDITLDFVIDVTVSDIDINGNRHSINTVFGNQLFDMLLFWKLNLFDIIHKFKISFVYFYLRIILIIL